MSSPEVLGVALPGCGGRMGRELVRALAEAEDLRLVAACEAPGSPLVGQDAGTVAGLPPLGVPITAGLDGLLVEAGGVIDFSVPAVSATLARTCAERGLPLVVGTTGLSEEAIGALRDAARRIAVVQAPNMSVGVNLLLALAQTTARLLGPGFQPEIVEIHHRHKADAPSGTALALAQAIEDGSGQALPRCHGRQGRPGPRPEAELGLHAVRGGDVVGEHLVLFLGTGERVELCHRATSRRTFAEGALRALRFAAQHAPGLYTMRDVLGL